MTTHIITEHTSEYMNEATKKLAAQAKEYAMERTATYNGYEPIGFLDYYTEKLTELIVQQCVSEIAMIGISNIGYDTDGDIDWTVSRSIGMIKRHFGVEE